MPISINRSDKSIFDDPSLVKKFVHGETAMNTDPNKIGSGALIANNLTGDIQSDIDAANSVGSVVIEKEKDPDDGYAPEDFGHSTVPHVMKRAREGVKEEVSELGNISQIIDASRRRIGAIAPLQQGKLWLVAYAINTGSVSTDDEIDILVKDISTGELRPDLTNPNHPDYKSPENPSEGVSAESSSPPIQLEESEYDFSTPTSGTYTTHESKLRSDVVEILINSTQLGDVLNVLKNEKDKIEFARRVRIVTTERKDVPTSTTRTKVSIDELYKHVPVNIEPTTWSMILPASRYKITLKSLTYSQLIALWLNPESASYEDYNRRYSTIYNSIVDASIGKFASYEDFMKRTAWEDSSLLIYTLAAATLGVEAITVSCPQCDTKSTISYDVKTLVDWSKVPDISLMAYKNTAEASTEEEIAKNYSNSILNKSTIYELPSKKVMVEFGGISILEFMKSYSEYVISENAKPKILALERDYKMGFRSDEMTAKWDSISKEEQDTYLATLQAFDPNTVFIYATIFSMLSVLRKVIIPIDGVEYELSEANDIIKYIYNNLEPTDMEVLTRLYFERIAAFQQPFRVPGEYFCTNPSCRQKLTIAIDPNTNLIFPQASRLMNSEYVLSR